MILYNHHHSPHPNFSSPQPETLCLVMPVPLSPQPLGTSVLLFLYGFAFFRYVSGIIKYLFFCDSSHIITSSKWTHVGVCVKIAFLFMAEYSCFSIRLMDIWYDLILYIYDQATVPRKDAIDLIFLSAFISFRFCSFQFISLFASLLKFIPKYRSLCNAILNGIVSFKCFGCVWKFPGQGSSPRWSCLQLQQQWIPSPCAGIGRRGRSLMHCATAGTLELS